MLTGMAEKLDSFSPAARDMRSGRSKYPWPEWTDGSVWKLTRGVDFDCKIENMRAIINVHAWRKGLKVETHAVGDTLEFQFPSVNGS